ncbi:efflux RND transporter periplasmic adaptor subunit [Labilibaculum sp. A4]|uniref:Efflux RND transporter periplasmic adaptor subunit n=1 Tax=Labilibaculum euxinus TaxID=2686357 RepID=A0A425YFZ2_9BACT|nr:efflux RND transporter periplasmic adaptor subunit [Labilibaculum euxinus]MDQ1770361.1 efflux RND transporter periplasmic adaptor subunit [Labilibaculum euxinus]MUP38366.1 efflux RND transporter periplasmic adaptor subunit [Labilibaculum euxinus]MVB07571.1 efflux RND transporter periplasmic adaptor subunit [Labilibaculum euxinus]MWN75419.1 efflux RND transporter periplasmic adaptor subunit [Labilibaculum euxinus]
MKRNYILASMAIILLGLSSCKDSSQPQMARGPMPFPVQSVKKENITIYTEYAANIEGEQNIEIRPKVDGFIEKIYIDEGSQVKEGQILFKLSAKTLNQQVKAAEANVEVAKAQVVSAQVDVNKIKPLVEKNIISAVQLETSESNLNAAKAQLIAARADYMNAKENLDYTIIKSPVDGIVGSIPYRIGSLVGRTESQPLTTVSNISNVYAYFSLNEKQLLQFNRQLNGNSVKDMIKALPEVELILADGSIYNQKGKIETINGMVNPRTGSVSYRAIFSNPDNLLRSGISGKIKLPSNIDQAIILPQKSTFELQGKHFVYLLGNENKIESKEVFVSETLGNDFIIEEGLTEGQVFVAGGLIKLREGMQILPQTGSSTQPDNRAFSKK